MKGRSKKAVFVLFGVAVLGLLSWGWLRAREPVYQSRPLSSWLEELERSWPDPGSEQSAHAIREIGADALPYLMAGLKARDSGLKLKFARFLRDQNRIKFRFRMAEEKRASALKAFFVLGPKAKLAIPELSRMLDEDRDTALYAIIALVNIGKDSMPVLAGACGHTHPDVRECAAVTLSQLASGRGLYTASRFRPDRLDSVTEFALGCGREDIPGLIANLSDPRPAVRRATAEALGIFFGVAESAIPELTRLLEDPDEGVRKAAAKAFKEINAYQDSLKPPIKPHAD